MAKIDTQHYRDDLDTLRKKFRELYNERMPALKDSEKLTNNAVSNLLGESLPAMKQLYSQAKGMGDAYEKDFLPATSDYLRSAQGYDTAERRTEASGRAMADVTTAGETARAGALQRLESYGIDPSQTRGQALDQNLRVQTALDAVKQGRDAEMDVEERGRAYTRDALGMGQGLVAGQQALSGTAAQIGGSAVGAGDQNARLWAGIYGTPVENLEARHGLINSGVAAKMDETKMKLAAKGGEGAAMAGIGQAVGTIGGGVAGYFASGGNPFGAMAGAQAGSTLAGGVTGGGGGATGMSDAAQTYSLGENYGK
jgi:hypothetical protein